jgi:hypothetical protein
VFLPRTGVTPPELYNYERTNKRLVRLGALGEYLSAAAKLQPTEGQLANINYQHTSEKRVKRPCPSSSRRSVHWRHGRT